MYYFYVLYSLKDKRLYKGYSTEPGARFLRHQSGGVTSTRYRRPLVLIYVESYQEKCDALARERWAKSAEGGSLLMDHLKGRCILDERNCLKTTRT